MISTSLLTFAEKLAPSPKQTVRGSVVSVKGSLIAASLPIISIGDICYVTRENASPLITQVVSFQADLCYLTPYESLDGVSPSAEVWSTCEVAKINIGEHLIGQVITALGEPYNRAFDHKQIGTPYNLNNRSPNPLTRLPIKEQLFTGIRSIDLFTPLGYGQRVGLFAGPGAGKSTLLGMIAKNSKVDLVVIALVGERGREINEFINENLGVEGLKRSIVIASSSDQSPLKRVMAVQTATSIAEYFREQGKSVLLLVDSLTRVARAIRDVSLNAGEVPLRQGYTSSVYTQLPVLLERAGNSDNGSITAIYTILTQNDESNDALGEEVKSIIDGHIVLDSSLANQGIRPAIDILNSISRLKEKLQNEEISELCKNFLKLYHRLRNDKDIVLLGGSPDKELELALKLESKIKNFLNQRRSESDYSFSKSLEGLRIFSNS